MFDDEIAVGCGIFKAFEDGGVSHGLDFRGLGVGVYDRRLDWDGEG